MRRNKGERKTDYVRHLLGILGFYAEPTDSNYELRHWGGADNESPAHLMPQVPIMPANRHTKVWRFVNNEDVGSGVWDSTNVGAGTALAVQDERGGVAKVTNGASDNNYYFYESKKELAQIIAGKSLWLSMEGVRIADVDQADMFVGLCARLASGNLFDNRVNAVGFYLTDGSALIRGETRSGGVATPNAAFATDMSDNIFVKLELWVKRNERVMFFADGSYLGENHLTLPSTEMCFAFGCRNGQASANALSIKEVRLIQE